MKKKRLPKEKAAEIVKLLAEGRDAKDLADSYKVSVATIYNFRTRLKREGAPVVPKKRGRKPKLAKAEVRPTSVNQEPKKLETTVKMEQYIFVINGVAVSVSGKAKNVHISKDSMIVNF
jgi:transposase